MGSLLAASAPTACCCMHPMPCIDPPTRAHSVHLYRVKGSTSMHLCITRIKNWLFIFARVRQSTRQSTVTPTLLFSVTSIRALCVCIYRFPSSVYCCCSYSGRGSAGQEHFFTPCARIDLAVFSSVGFSGKCCAEYSKSVR
jgi:hypothetical protein